MQSLIRKKLGKEHFLTYLGVLAISGIIAFTFLNILFPLAIYSSMTKVLLVLLGYLLAAVLSWVGYRKGIKPVLPNIQKGWVKIVVVSAGITILILSLSPLHLPYHPVEHQLTIETNSPDLGFLSADRFIDDEIKQVIKPEMLSFSGAWNHHGGVSIHQGTTQGIIEYQQIEYVRGTLRYKLTFVTASEITTAKVTIDNQEHWFEIDANESDDAQPSYFNVEITPPEKSCGSRVWQLIISIFPSMAGLSVFLLLLFGCSVIVGKLNAPLTSALQLALFGVVFYLFWLTLNYQSGLFYHNTQQPGLLIATAFLMVIFPLIINPLLDKKPEWIQILLAASILIGVGLRIYWILMVPSAQVSDFGRFHHWALQLANHEPGLAIDRYANFTRTLSLLYRVFPTHVAVEVLNILLAAATSICLYWIGKVNQHARIGLLAAYWLAIYPVHISMTSIVNTDIPAAFLLVLSVLLISLYVHQQKLVYLVLSGLIFAFCLFLRGAMLIYLPGILILLFLQRKQKATYYLASSGLLLLVLLLTTSGLSAAIKQVKVTGLTINESRYLMWPLVNGTNIEKLGRNNPEDTQMVFSWQTEEINRNGFAVVGERIFSDPLGFYGLLKAKFEHLFANATYGADVAFLDENHEYRSFQTGWNAPIEAVREGYAQVSQYAYLSILLLALIAVLKTDQDQIALWLPPLFLLLCALGAYAFFEVQPRYSFPLIPFLILLAGMLFVHRKPEGDFQ